LEFDNDKRGGCITMEELKQLAKEFLAKNKVRDELNDIEDYDGAFEIECDQRDIGSDMADLILKMKANNFE
jgi:hypothetical protein